MADSAPTSKLPVFLPPAPPTRLLSYIIAQHVYPATLVIGSSKDAFLRALTRAAESAPDTAETRTLLAASLFQTAVAKHIRVVFVPTVSHLRAYLAVFSPHDSPVPPPPGYAKPNEDDNDDAAPGLVVYGLLDLHRESSEWNAQGVMRSLAAVVDAASRTGFSPALVEPLLSATEEADGLEKLTNEEVPLLGYSQGGQPRLSKRTVPLSKIIQRWFRLSSIDWAEMVNTRSSEAEIEDHDHDHASQEDAAMTQADE